ncbi:MAG TPA: MauE/DoxX family redox-associated membrane protein [Chloroflexota bacterium]|nr:MauE/DoxX family redox-associated membrane protein [Chloroflexota bacterium]
MIAIRPRARTIALAFRLFLAVVFLIAGGSKLAHANLFVTTVQGYKMLPDSLVRPFGLALPWIETLLALYLLVGLFTRLAAVATSALIVMFLLALGVQLAHGHTGDCGCVVGIDNPVITAFVGGANIGPWDLVRDSILLLMAAFVAITPRPLLAVDGWLQARREADEDLYYEQDTAGSPVV